MKFSNSLKTHIRFFAFAPFMTALILLAGHPFAQAQEISPSPTATEQSDSSALERAASSSPTPAPPAESSTSTPTVNPSSSALKKMSLEQLMNLDVTSVDKQPEPYGEAPAAIDVITNDEIRRSGASSIPEALQLADNLEVAQKDSHDWAISARGFNTDSANKLLVLMDGRSVYTPLFSGVFWDLQDYLLEDIDRIEVISGPGGTLWGANAVNGVINITSKSAKDTQGAYVEGGGGTELQDFEGVRYGGTVDSNIYYRIYGKYFVRDSEDLASGTAAGDNWEMGQGGFRIDAEPSSMETFTLQGDVYDGDSNLSTGGNSNMNGNNVIGRWSRTFADDSNMTLQLYYDRTYLYDPVPESAIGALVVAPSGVLTDSLDTYDADFQYHFHLDDHNNLIWGLGYRFTHDVTTPAPGLAFDPSTLDQNLYNGFAQDEIKLVEKLTLTLGSKIEHNDYTGYEFEPSGRLQWDVADKQMIWCAVSRAVRTPSRVDRDEELLTPKLTPYGINDLLIGGSDFESETLIAYELGYRAQFDSKVSVSLSGFFNNYDDIRSANPTPGGVLDLPYVFENNLQAQTGGFEFSGDYQVVDGLRLHGGYDLLKENIWVKPGQVDINNALNETADPQNQVFFRASMDLPENIELDPALRWIDSFIYNNGGAPETVPSYMELNVRLAWHATQNIELSVTGQNLLHPYHLEYVISSPAPEEEIARSVYGKVVCQF